MSEFESINGLSKEEVNQRIEQGHTNFVQKTNGRTYKQIIKDNVLNFINILIFGIAFLLIVFGRYSDGLIYCAVGAFNIFVSLTQELNAKRKLGQIASLTAPKNRVMREGVELEVSSKELVLDDICLLQSGEISPVDGEVVRGGGKLDESLLTGESQLVGKKVGDVILAGSSVVSGSSIIKAVNVGNKTLANKISEKARKYSTVLTPLQKEVNFTIRLLTAIAVFLTGLVTLYSFNTGREISESLQIAAVVIGIVPNSLFAMINLAYALGGVRILRKGALVQRLSAVESLSTVDVLCLDKTGTITNKNLEVQEVYSIGSDKIVLDENFDENIDTYAKNISDHNATSQALLSYNEVFNPTNNNISRAIEEVPFSSEYKWSAIKTEDNILILGAPEVFLNNLDQKEQERLSIILTKIQNKGLRALMFATSNNNSTSLFNEDSPILPESITITKIISFSDQIREGIAQTLDEFKATGVRLKIISGDNSVTVKALAKQINFKDNGVYTILTGAEIDEMNQFELMEAVRKVDIFGRITPDQKERIIRALQTRGSYVAMIGDGVNDVMSLKLADLGVSLESGAQSARNVSDIILLGDNFNSLPSGLKEGQKIRNGLEDVFKVYLTRTLYLVILIISIQFLALPFPLSVKQNSLIAILASGGPAIALTIWAPTGKRKNNKILPSIASFVIPAALTTSTIAILLYSILVRDKAGEAQITSIFDTYVDFNELIDTYIVLSQSTLTTFLIFAGIITALFVAPPFRIKNKKPVIVRDIRPTLFILSLLAIVFYLIKNSNQFKNFWDVKLPTSGDEVIAIFVALGLWFVILILFWKNKWLERFLGISFKNEKKQFKNET